MKTNRSVSKDTVLGLFRCSPSLLADLPKIEGNDVVKRRDNNCEASKVRVIKTISLRKSGVLPWIVDHDDIKVKFPSSIVCFVYLSLSAQVVHLVRDPRAIISSRYNFCLFDYFIENARLAGGWSEGSIQADLLCDQLLGDLDLREHLPPERFLC